MDVGTRMGFRSPDRPARSQSLYRLSYPAYTLYAMVYDENSSHEAPQCLIFTVLLPYVHVHISFFNTLHLHSFRVRRPILRKFKTRSKIVLLYILIFKVSNRRRGIARLGII
jgi:hypothetical protein